MIQATAEMFGADNQKAALFAAGLAWSSAGITGLRTSAVNPYHHPVPMSERSKSHKVVYAVVFDTEGDDGRACPLECFFEDDYETGFARFRSFKALDGEEGEHYLLAAYLVTQSEGESARTVWQSNIDYIAESSLNCLVWSDRKGRWA